MAAWKPVVATDWGGPKDLIVDGVTGFKVLGRNPQQHIDMLVSAIERLIGDPELRRRMGIAAVARVRDEFVWRRLADRYERLYRALA
jgi:glycosyltransferase involved in cell wall biosynthesis